jgi:hypothetical protein
MRKRKIIFIIISAIILNFYAIAQQGQKKRIEYQLSIQDEQGNEIGLYNKSFALIIGVSDYTAGWPDLPGVSKDIIEVEKVLVEHGFNVIVVKNPTKDELVSAIEDFISKYGRNLENRILVYFAGHGHTIKLAYGGDMGYIVPSDASNPNYDKQGFQDKAIDMRRFDSYARAIESKHALFLFDSCFSGSIFALTRAVPEVISYKTSQPVRQFITAGSADELVPDESIFKSQFISGIRGEADRDEDGYITGTELGEFLQSKVVNYSEGSQHPQYGKIRDALLDKGDFVFVLSAEEEEPVDKRDKSLTTEIELEFWRSTRESNTEEAYNAYLKQFPDGHFAALAKQRINELREEKNSVVTEPESQETVETVRLLKLIPRQIQIYNESIKQYTVADFPEEIRVQGQVSLTLTIRGNGQISIESINDSVLNVSPNERRGYIKNSLQDLIEGTQLDSPKDKTGLVVRVTGWKVSYSCEVVDGKLIFRKIGI